MYRAPLEPQLQEVSLCVKLVLYEQRRSSLTHVISTDCFAVVFPNRTKLIMSEPVCVRIGRTKTVPSPRYPLLPVLPGKGNAVSGNEIETVSNFPL